MANFDLRTFLTENKLTRVSKTLVKENDQNLSSSPKLFASFDENIETIYAYEDLGFNVQEDDDVNNIFSAELQFDGLDWMAVLAVLEDCERAGLDPNMSWNGKQYTFEEAMKLADSKAAGGMNEAPANEAITEGDSFDYSNLILSTINSLTDMGEEGENALRVLGKISDWNEVVRLATEE
jgi:hypothetical protein